MYQQAETLFSNLLPLTLGNNAGGSVLVVLVAIVCDTIYRQPAKP